MNVLVTAAPMAFIVEQAGGLALTGKNRIMVMKQRRELHCTSVCSSMVVCVDLVIPCIGSMNHHCACTLFRDRI